MAFDDDWKWIAARHSEAQTRLYDALRRKHYDTARWITGVPPAPDDRDPDDLDEPEETGPPTVEAQFREHARSLLFNLEWAADFLPGRLLADWAARAERLDLAEPEAGLAAMQAMQREYERAAEFHEPPNSEVSRRIEWDFYVPRIGHEIAWLAALFRHVLSFRG